jgi:two-component system chemotaxis response regulator CheY
MKPPDTLTMLVVDDSVMMRALIRRAIVVAGVPGDVLEAANGREALDVLERRPIDVLFTDINMPVMDGAALLAEIAARDMWRPLLRVVISTDGSEARREELAALADHYVEKPFKPEVVRDVLACIIPAAE